MFYVPGNVCQSILIVWHGAAWSLLEAQLAASETGSTAEHQPLGVAWLGSRDIRDLETKLGNRVGTRYHDVVMALGTQFPLSSWSMLIALSIQPDSSYPYVAVHRWCSATVPGIGVGEASA